MEQCCGADEVAPYRDGDAACRVGVIEGVSSSDVLMSQGALGERPQMLFYWWPVPMKKRHGPRDSRMSREETHSPTKSVAASPSSRATSSPM
jgi:hypothetical protein